MPEKDYPSQYTYYDGKYIRWLQDSSDVNKAEYPSAALFNTLFGTGTTA